MPEFTDANSGGLDPTGIPSSRPPRSGRTRVYLLLGVIWAVLGGMAAGGCIWVFSSFRSRSAWDDRVLAIMGAAGLAAPLFFGVRAYIQARCNRGCVSVQFGTEARPPRQCASERCDARAGSLTTYIFKWAGYAAMQPSCSFWQRAAAWIVLFLYASTVFALAALGVVMIGAGLGTLPGGVGLAAIGLAALIWPFVALRSLVRGIRAGKLGTTREEFDQFRAAHEAWRTSQSQMPLRKKLIGTAFALACLGFWWLHDSLRHPGKGGHWIAPATWAVPLAYSVWVQFRRPRNTPR